MAGVSTHHYLPLIAPSNAVLDVLAIKKVLALVALTTTTSGLPKEPVQQLASAVNMQELTPKFALNAAINSLTVLLALRPIAHNAEPPFI